MINHATPRALQSQSLMSGRGITQAGKIQRAAPPQTARLGSLQNDCARPLVRRRFLGRRANWAPGTANSDGDVRVVQLTASFPEDTSTSSTDDSGGSDGELLLGEATLIVGVGSIPTSIAGASELLNGDHAAQQIHPPIPPIDPGGVASSQNGNKTGFVDPVELSRIMTLAGPLMVQNVFGYLMSVVSVTAIGRIGTAELAAASLATSIYTVTGHSLVLGLSSAMETLCGQAYGAGDYKALGDVLQRALCVCWAFCIPVAFLWLQSSSLMVAVGQDPEISKMAGRYLALCIPCIFLDIATDCMKKYLQAQGIVTPAMYATTVATLLSPVFFFVVIHLWGWGLDGAAAALILCHLTPLAGVAGFMIWHTRKAAGSRRATWGGFSASAAFSKWGQYLKYGLPAMLMISLDWWVYEVAVLMTGWLPNAQAALSVGGICVALNTWAYMVPVGLSSAVNTCVSNALGSGDGLLAKRTATTGLASAAAVQAMVVLGVTLFGEWIIRMIATDPAVVVLAMRTLPVLCLLMFWDGLNVVMSGILRGAGQQAMGAQVSGATFVVACIACYGFAFKTPAWLLAAVPLLAAMEPVARVWLGVAVAVLAQTAVLLSYISGWDWEQQARRVIKNMIAEGVVSTDEGDEGLGLGMPALA